MAVPPIKAHREFSEIYGVTKLVISRAEISTAFDVIEQMSLSE